MSVNIESFIYYMEKVFFELGFEVKIIGDKQYRYLNYNNCYCKITYLERLSAFVIESADNIEDAINGILEDGDLYFLDVPEEKVLCQLHKDIQMYYIE